jgi:hypothetical protein
MQKTTCSKCGKDIIYHTDLPIPKKVLCFLCREDFSGEVKIKKPLTKNITGDKK